MRSQRGNEKSLDNGSSNQKKCQNTCRWSPRTAPRTESLGSCSSMRPRTRHDMRCAWKVSPIVCSRFAFFDSSSYDDEMWKSGLANTRANLEARFRERRESCRDFTQIWNARNNSGDDAVVRLSVTEANSMRFARRTIANRGIVARRR